MQNLNKITVDLQLRKCLSYSKTFDNRVTKNGVGAKTRSAFIDRKTDNVRQTQANGNCKTIGFP